MLVGAQTWTVDRMAGDGDPYETDAQTERFKIVGTLSSPSGRDRHVGGRLQRIDSVLIAAPVPYLAAGDQVTADGEVWTIAWVQTRTGLGLGHQRCGINRADGAANG